MAVRARAARNGRADAAAGIEAADEQNRIEVRPLKEVTLAFRIIGTAPYLQLKFSQKAIDTMAGKMMQGDKAKNRKARDPRDFGEDYRQCLHVSAEGWYGIPATAIKAAMVSACRLVGVPMTRAKILFHVVADGFDAGSGDPLVKIAGEPRQHVGPVRNANGSADLRVRAMWDEWSAVVRVRYDDDAISGGDVLALLYRAGKQVGIGEGRPDSKKSCGMGLGTFDVEPHKEG